MKLSAMVFMGPPRPVDFLSFQLINIQLTIIINRHGTVSYWDILPIKVKSSIKFKMFPPY